MVKMEMKLVLNYSEEVRGRCIRGGDISYLRLSSFESLPPPRDQEIRLGHGAGRKGLAHLHLLFKSTTVPRRQVEHKNVTYSCLRNPLSARPNRRYDASKDLSSSWLSFSRLSLFLLRTCAVSYASVLPVPPYCRQPLQQSYLSPSFKLFATIMVHFNTSLSCAVVDVDSCTPVHTTVATQSSDSIVWLFKPRSS